MLEKKMKFNVIFCSLLTAFAAFAGDSSALPKAGNEQHMTPPPTDESGGSAKAQFLYGVFCKEKLKDDQEAYKYLELAAKKNHRGAWLYLGNCYMNRKDEHHSYLKWAKLCFMAAEKIEKSAIVEFYIGLTEGLSGNLPEFKKWMKIAADNGHEDAVKILKDKSVHNEINAIKIQRERELVQNALKHSINSHFEKLREFTGKSGTEFIDNLRGNAGVSPISKMIRLAIPENIFLPGWTYDPVETEKFIAEHLMADRHGDLRWITDKFIEQPIGDNLLYPNPTIRRINSEHESRIRKFLDKSAYRLCSKEETARLIEPLKDADMPENYYDDDLVWDLGKGLYFRIHVASDGRWQLRDYEFFLMKDGKVALREVFPTPPGVEDAAIIAGIVQGDLNCLSNLAVKYADGEMDHVFRRDDEAEEILKLLFDNSHFIGTYNLAVFYQSRNKNAEAKKYFELAEKFAGSSVISYSVNPPEIFDRDGNLLVKNRLYRTSKKDKIRIHVNGGRFAASLIGHIQEYEWKFGRDAAWGFAGIEEIITRKNINHPVYLTIDSSLQKQLEKLIADIDSQSTPRYAYGVIVNSKGELVAAAQNIVFDLEKRDFANPDQWNFNFMPSGYLFPVPDQWMKLLGSSSTADPLSKEKLQLHRKQNVFAAEAQGVVLGLNRMNGVRDPKRVSGQTATMLNYVCAYIGTVEKKAIPKLSVYTDAVNTPTKFQDGVSWVSFYRPPDGIVVNAIGVIKTADPNNNLYICVRAVYEERNFAKPLSKEATRVAAANADKAEKIIKEFTVTAEKTKK